jgi:hypothetical protein
MVVFCVEQSSTASLCDTIGELALSGPVELHGNVFVSTLRRSTLFFPAAVSGVPVSDYASSRLSPAISNEDTFASQLTISFFVHSDNPASDAPLIELLGATFGQVCAVVRIGCSGTCIHFLSNPACTCPPSSKEFRTTHCPSISSWTHFAVTVDKQASGSIVTYLQGIVAQTFVYSMSFKWSEKM